MSPIPNSGSSLQSDDMKSIVKMMDRVIVLLPGPGKLAWKAGKKTLDICGVSLDAPLVDRAREMSIQYRKLTALSKRIESNSAVLKRNIKRGGGLVRFSQGKWENTANALTVRDLESELNEARDCLEALGTDVNSTFREMQQLKTTLDQTWNNFEKLRLRVCQLNCVNSLS